MTLDELIEQLERRRAAHGGNIEVVNGEDYTPIQAVYTDIKSFNDETPVIVIL